MDFKVGIVTFVPPPELEISMAYDVFETGVFSIFGGVFDSIFWPPVLVRSEWDLLSWLFTFLLIGRSPNFCSFSVLPSVMACT